MFKLRLQFFWVMLALTSLMSVGIYLFIKISFKIDFWDYIEKRETRFAQPLVEDLETNYASHGDWNWIEDWNAYLGQQLQFQRNNWRRDPRQPQPYGNQQPPEKPQQTDRQPNGYRTPAMPQPTMENGETIPPAGQAHPNGHQTFGEDPYRNDHEPHHNEAIPPYPGDPMAERANPNEPNSDKKQNPFKSWRDSRQRPPMEAMRTIYLEDDHHKLIKGENQHGDESFLIPITVEGKTVGYLGIPFNPAIRDLQDANFAKVQENKVGFIVVAALILSVLAAFPLAHLLTTRIQRLVEQVRQYSTGNYQERLNLRGSDEINILAEHLNHLGETLGNTEQTRRQWVADISHELRTPIAVLQAELEAMEDGVRAIDAVAIKRLIKHSERLKFLVNDLYELSLTDIGGMTYQKKNMDLANALNEAIGSLQPQFNQQGISLETSVSDTNLPFFGDTQRLQQLFVNLLKNSLNYTTAPGKTRITTLCLEGSYQIVIEDTPPGVKPEHLNKLFDRLYRADSSRTRATGGAGLGLSICKNIVQAHEGKISANISELGGLKVTVELPQRG